MPRADQNATHRIFMSLWFNWAMTMLALCVTIFLAQIVSKAWMPLPVALLAYSLLVYSRRVSASSGCVMILRYGMSVLIWTAIIMATINVLNSRMLLDGLIDWSNSNRDIPYITILIMAPVMFFSSLWHILIDRNSHFCDACRARNGHVQGNNVVSRIYDNESSYQLQVLLFVSATLTAVEYWYYFTYYININFNNPDRFFFVFMPLLIMAFMVVFMLMRYTNMSRIIGPMTIGESNDMSIVRYLVLAGDCLLLDKGVDGRWDTPASAEVEPISFLSEADATADFKRISDIDGASLRFLYANKTHSNTAQILHYAAFLDDNCHEAFTGRLRGEWFTLDMLDRMMRTADLSAELSNELYRIFTITMAWKTYTPEGRRRYPIKRYRPTFRLRDLKNWDVDYDDLHWFDVANNNEDRRFFRTRRLWQRLTGQSSR